jgi:16S rRNA (guanine1207-N2)-methyltransferase
MSHYFSKNNDDLKTLEKDIFVQVNNKKFSFTTDHGVFSKAGLDFGSRLLIESVLTIPVKTCLDLGSGYGPLGIIYKTFNPDAKVSASDINERAVKLARKNAKKNKVDIEVLESDGFEKINGDFDLIICNPPIRAGKAIIYRFFEDAYNHLAAEGYFIFVMNKKHGSPSAIKKCESIYQSVEIMNKKSGYQVIKCRK